MRCRTIFGFASAVPAAAILTWALAGGLAASAAAEGEEAERGFAKSVRCVACHGADGVAPNPTFPSLAGQNAAYLELQLHRFRSGERYHPVMSPIAESLTAQDIADLSIYYSGIGPLAESRNIR